MATDFVFVLSFSVLFYDLFMQINNTSASPGNLSYCFHLAARCAYENWSHMHTAITAVHSAHVMFLILLNKHHHFR